MIINRIKDYVKNIYDRITRSLANRMAVFYTIIVTVFITALIMTSYFRTIFIIRNDFVDNNKSILKLVCQNLNNYIKQIDDFSLTMRMDQDGYLITILSSNINDFQSDYYIENEVRNLFNARNDIVSVKFYVPSSQKEFSISRDGGHVSVTGDVSRQSNRWYKLATEGKHFRYIETEVERPGTPKDADNKQVFFTFHRAFTNISSGRILGVVSVAFDYSMINEIYQNDNSGNGGILCIYNRDNKLFYCSDLDLINRTEIHDIFKGISENSYEGNKQITIDGKDYLMVYTFPGSSEWKAVKLIPVDELNDRVLQTRNISFFMGMIFIMIFAAIIIFASKFITSSLSRLSKQMDKVGKGNFKVKAEVTGNDEIAQLANKFNLMVEEIDELVNEKYLAKLNEKSAQLKALEAQINPHFLYNSLQAISARAVLSGNKDISRMVEALARNFRYCIKGKDIVTISDEIEHINNYLILHKARHEDRLCVDISVESSTMDINVPKLSIFTLVENSIKYSLESVVQNISIKIHTYQEEDRIIITVSDNGPGMSEERLAEIRKLLNDGNKVEKVSESIGLKNLNERLNIIYDNAARLDIKSSPGMGTEISIILPADKEDRNV